MRKRPQRVAKVMPPTTATPMPQRALEQYHLVLKKCPAQNQRMRDVLVYPDKGGLRPEEEKFIELLRRQAALTVK